jgi:hypothetical protein
MKDEGSSGKADEEAVQSRPVCRKWRERQTRR